MFKYLKFFLSITLLISAETYAQDTLASKTDKLLIGLTETPPFVVKDNGGYSGLSISSWKLVNDELGADYEFKAYPSLVALLDAVEKGEVDFSINPVTVTDLRMQRMDFSQPYFISFTGVAKKSETMIWSYLANLFSWNFIKGILILLGVILLFGFLVWIFEHKKNKEEFGPGARGILQGFWWSAVTMTTVGYGDKAPRTFGGRFIGFIWMFMAIVMISGLTAGIASSLTVQSISDEINSVEDLKRFDVVTVTGSSALELLDQYAVKTEEVADERQGIQDILDEKSSLFVYDQPILKYEIERRNLGDELEVLQQTLKRDYYGYSFPKNSPLLKKIDPILVGTLKTMEWNKLLEDY
ncbi:MAG TPA: transporter substrate-binding domain-containing protein [Salegentibacter sp.]|uniref:transporter substrate-binding domain-containing protein n=1 Tax=Salegentibacter sp. TaxID=1903072 RepID=UPI002F9562FF